MPEAIICNVGRCARCGSDHTQVRFEPFREPCEQHTHWAMCPVLNEPILLLIEPEDPMTEIKALLLRIAAAMGITLPGDHS